MFNTGHGMQLLLAKLLNENGNAFSQEGKHVTPVLEGKISETFLHWHSRFESRGYLALQSGWFRAGLGVFPSFAGRQRHRVVVLMSPNSAHQEKAKRFSGAAPFVWEQFVQELRCRSWLLDTDRMGSRT